MAALIIVLVIAAWIASVIIRTANARHERMRIESEFARRKQHDKEFEYRLRQAEEETKEILRKSKEETDRMIAAEKERIEQERIRIRQEKEWQKQIEQEEKRQAAEERKLEQARKKAEAAKQKKAQTIDRKVGYQPKLEEDRTVIEFHLHEAEAEIEHWELKISEMLSRLTRFEQKLNELYEAEEEDTTAEEKYQKQIDILHDQIFDAEEKLNSAKILKAEIMSELDNLD